jgi:hypothetical protein
MKTDALSSNVKYYICPFVNVLDIGRQILVENFKIKFHEHLAESFIAGRQRVGNYTSVGLRSS